jgi:AraC-like DNA-binding protein
MPDLGVPLSKSESDMQRPFTHGAVERRWTVAEMEVIDCVHRPWMRLPRHDHERPSLQIALAGVCRERVGCRDIELRPATAYYRPADAAHANEIGANPFHSLLIGLPIAALHVPECVTTESSSSFVFDAREIVRELSAQMPGWHPMVESAVLGVLGRLQRRSTRLDGGPWVERAAELAAEGASIDEIARQVERGPSMVAKAFKHRFGISVGAFCRRERLRRAARDLRGGKAISDVALESGFFDQSHFTRAFRVEFGVTPARYRREVGAES